MVSVHHCRTLDESCDHSAVYLNIPHDLTATRLYGSIWLTVLTYLKAVSLPLQSF